MHMQKKLTMSLMAAALITLTTGNVNADSLDTLSVEFSTVEHDEYVLSSNNDSEKQDDDPVIAPSYKTTVNAQTHSNVNDSSGDNRHTLPFEFNQNIDTELNKPEQDFGKDESLEHKTANDGNVDTSTVDFDIFRQETNMEDNLEAEDIVIASMEAEKISSKAGISDISDSISFIFWTWPCILLILLLIFLAVCIKRKKLCFTKR